jgi:segregation and condensation protein B
MPGNLAEKRIEPSDPAEALAMRAEELRLLEAMLFASNEPLDEATLKKKLPDGIDIKSALEQLQADYAMRGVNLVRVNGQWSFRTASDLSWLMTRESTETKRLSRRSVASSPRRAPSTCCSKPAGSGRAAGARRRADR